MLLDLFKFKGKYWLGSNSLLRIVLLTEDTET